ncbi:MAG TPA: hypothetical protein PKZ76_01570, partial [Xanthomonadaceae bacterium]|nr:hypothetical protein [Xanthomonadaceae bacterium]
RVTPVTAWSPDMAAMFQPNRIFQVACHQFAPAEIEALRSLLKLLHDYLKRPWQVVDEPAHADVVLVNLDHPDPQPLDAAAVQIGCAQKPRLKRSDCIHRPLRAAEVLAVLSEAAMAGDDGSPAPRAETQEGTNAFRYRLRAWPLEFLHWPRESWPVLAAMTRCHASIKEISLRTGQSQADIERTLAMLKKMHLLDCLVERRALPRVDLHAMGGWRGLANRVGQLLGFAQ